MQMIYFFGFLLIVGVIISILTNPVFWIIVGVVVVVIIIAACSSESKDTTVSRSGYNEWNKSTARVTSKPKQQYDLDEEIDATELIKVRDVLNTFDFRKALTNTLREELINKLVAAGSSEFTKGFSEDVRALDLKTARKFFADFKKALNSEDLEDYETITPREILEYILPEEELENRVAELNGETSDSIEEDEEINSADKIALGALGYMASSEYNKKQRIKKLRNEVKKLDNEYKFERGFDPDWDEDEYLSSKYKGVDEEKYLKARKEELKQKNLAYDYYLTPEERDEDDDGNW